MTNSIFWVALATYAVHILVEFFCDSRRWAQQTLMLPIDRTTFNLNNSVELFLGLVSVSIGWKNPVLALAYPALMLINGIFFHVLPVIVARRLTPGLLSACIMIFPTCFFVFTEAIDRNVSNVTIGWAMALGYLIVTFPFALLITKNILFSD